MKFFFGHHENRIYAGTTLAQYEMMSAGPLLLEAGFPEGYIKETASDAEDLFKILAAKGCPSVNAACDFLDWMLQAVSQEMSSHLDHVINKTLREDKEYALIFGDKPAGQEEDDE